MADKSISELTAATAVGSTDLFVLEQTGTAKKLTGQILENWLVSYADGHGGIQSIELTGTSGTNPVIDTYTITLSDETRYDITVTNGVKGDTGDQTYVWIKWSAAQPTQDSDMGDVPDAWIGIYSGLSSTAPTTYTSYEWYNYKGGKGDTGDPITSVVRTSGDGSPGTNDTYTFYVNTTAVGTATIHNGSDGTGTVNSVNDIGVDLGTHNITLTAADVGAPKIPLHLSDTVTSLPKTITNSNITADMRVINCVWGTPSAIQGNVTWTTSAGSLVLSGTMSGSTTVDIDLIETT